MSFQVILFLGDGMSLSTVAATRVYLGDEDMQLSFEKFPYSGFSKVLVRQSVDLIRLSLTLCACLSFKTYCVDAQVADSACTATAYLTGVKTNYEMIGLNAKAKVHDCDAQTDEENLTESVLRWAQKSCKSAGIVTNTRITHASPAG